MAKHSAIVGGSTVGRLLACPGSHQAILALPPTVDVPSEYAEEGTFAHAVMEALMHRRMRGEPWDTASLRVGTVFHDRALTDEHIDSMIEPALEQLFWLEEGYGGGFTPIGIEQRVRFPRVPGAFGTVDLILQSRAAVLHVDWKFGSGVGVRAVYDDPLGDLVNPQLMYYVAAALHDNPAWYRKRTILAAIIQPRVAEPLTHTQITRAELRTFVADVEAAVIAAVSRDPIRSRGEHCRFAPCKITCPLWTGPLLDLSVLNPVARPTSVPAREITPYGEYLARAKALLDSAVMLKKEVDEQMHAYLMSGGKVPGWRLKPKTKQRQWVDEETVARELRALGFSPAEIWQSKLQTFAAADAIAKRRGVVIPDHLRVAPLTDETTLATTDDPAPVVEPTLALELFTAALKQLKAG